MLTGSTRAIMEHWRRGRFWPEWMIGPRPRWRPPSGQFECPARSRRDTPASNLAGLLEPPPYFPRNPPFINRTTEAVSAAVLSATVPFDVGPSLNGDQPKFLTFHGPFGSAAVSTPAIRETCNLSIRSLVSVWQLTQSVLKKWLLAGSAIKSSAAFVLLALT